MIRIGPPLTTRAGGPRLAESRPADGICRRQLLTDMACQSGTSAHACLHWRRLPGQLFAIVVHPSDGEGGEAIRRGCLPPPIYAERL